MNIFFNFSLNYSISMSWSQLVHPSAHPQRLSGSEHPSPASPSDLSAAFVLESEMGLASNGQYRSAAEPVSVRLPPLHLSQFRMNISPENFRPIREPEHYEKIDQIGRGERKSYFPD